MYQPMLFIHWKQIRIALIPFVIASFGLPLATVHGLGPVAGAPDSGMLAYRVIAQSGEWLVLYPLLAAAIGATLALSAWNWDHQLKHVYALSLPLSRWRYAALKMGAGGVLALLPAGAFWIGSLVASASVTLPTGLHTYPTLLAVRFLSAILISYALLFAMAAGTVRTTVWIITGITAFLVFSGLSANFMATHFVTFQQQNILEWVVNALTGHGGPFQVFAGNWALIDV